MNNSTLNTVRIISVISLILLILLTLLWEWQIAPLRMGGSWLALKALPLCLPLSGCLKGKVYTYQYSSMLILFYLAEGVTRLFDISLASRICAGIEIILSLIFFTGCLMYVRTFRRLQAASGELNHQ